MQAINPATGAANAPAFEAGEMVVHPGHGLGQVLGVEVKDLNGQKVPFYAMKIVDSGVKIMVAVASTATVGLRAVMSAREADKVLAVLKMPEVAVDVQPWSRRQRVYAEMLKSGDPFEIAKVMRDMYRLKSDKNLSFGERKLLDQARGLIIHELGLAKRVKKEAIEAELQAIFSA